MLSGRPDSNRESPALHPPKFLTFGVPRIELGLPAPKAGVLPVYYTPINLGGQEAGAITITLRTVFARCSELRRAKPVCSQRQASPAGAKLAEAGQMFHNKCFTHQMFHVKCFTNVSRMCETFHVKCLESQYFFSKTAFSKSFTSLAESSSFKITEITSICHG